MKNYQEVPSSAIDSITIDSDTNQVVVKYKSSAKSYTYSTEDAESFDTQLLAEFDSEDISVGRFINQSVNQGTLTLLQDWPYHTHKYLSRGDCTYFSVNIPCRPL